PKVAIITNIEEDHLDCYKNIEEIIESFRDFAALVPQDGLIISNAGDPSAAQALREAPARIELCSLTDPKATWFTKPLGTEYGCHKGTIFQNSNPIGILALSIPGKHNLMNATM